MQRASASFRLLGDPTRLRLLRVLAHDRFNVSELTGILGLAQSGVSRHLGLLKDAGLVVEERERGFVYYRLADAERAAIRTPPLWPLLDAQFAAPAPTTGRCAQDEARLQEVLRLRKETLRRRTATRGSWCPAAAGRPGRAPSATCCRRSTSPTSAAARATCRRSRRAGRAPSSASTAPTMCWSARRRWRQRRQVTNVEWKKGDLARLPLRDASVDVALLSQALHHASDPERAVAEAVRVLRPQRTAARARPASAPRDLGQGALRRPAARLLAVRAGAPAARRRAERRAGHHRRPPAPAIRSPC